MIELKAAMPCLREPGMALFGTTADQRLQLGEHIFTQTHTPMRLRRSPADNRTQHENSSEILHEQALLERLLQTSYTPGNRVFALFGAAGAGKSELMAWLALQFQAQRPEQPIVRIGRNDLNPLQLTEIFKRWLDDTYFHQATHKRWAEMQRKPRTFAKLLLLHALEAVVDDDALINALYYRLVDALTPAIARLLETGDVERGDIFPREMYDRLRAETVLPIQFDYEQFRHALLQTFREEMLEGFNVAETLSALSAHLHARGERPVLLIDDLVQSVTVFSTEFMDYFITLESGNWDVVIGLTPASLQDDARNRLLLERLTYLDTVDDRVEKWWLSDERGDESVFLDESTCVAFAHRYLVAFRQLNGVMCSRCPSFVRCHALAADASAPHEHHELHEPPILAPFNDAAIVRLFRTLPPGKGRARYFLRALSTVLSALLREQSIEAAFSEVGQSDLEVETDDGDRHVRAVGRWYLPPYIKDIEGENATATRIPAGLGAFWQVEDQVVQVQSLRHASVGSAMPADAPDSGTISLDPGRMAVQAWLEGDGEAERQLLVQLRKGAATWVKSFGAPDVLHRWGIAHPSRTLRLLQVESGSTPAVTLEGVDIDSRTRAAIRVRRRVGHAAFRLNDMTAASAREKQSLHVALASDARVLALLWDGEQIQRTAETDLALNIGMSLAQLGYIAGVLHWLTAEENRVALLPGLAAPYKRAIVRLRRRLSASVPGTRWSLTPGDATNLDALFADQFQLRKTLYDGSAIADWSRRLRIGGVLHHWVELGNADIPSEYRVGQTRFTEFTRRMSTLAQHLLACFANPEPHADTTVFAIGIASKLEDGQPVPLREAAPALDGLSALYPDLYEQTVLFKTRLDMATTRSIT